MKVAGFAGFSGSGKTTLIERLIPELRARGQRVSVIKHAHHGFDVDTPGRTPTATAQRAPMRCWPHRASAWC